MSRRDDMVAALECRQPQGAVPLWEIHFHCWEKASGRRFISGQDFLPLSPQERDRALEEDAEIIVSVAHELGFGGVTIPDPPWDCPYTLPQEARLRLAGLLRSHDPDFLVVAGAGGVMAMPDAGDYEAFCYRIFDAPEEIDELAEQTLRSGLESVKQARDAGVEAVYTASDLADNHGPFFRPEQLERWVWPYLTEWVAQVKEMGIYTIIHSDGDIETMLEGIIASGIHAAQAIDPVAGMDIQKVKAQVGGRLCLCGNVDSGLLVLGPPDRIYEDTRDILEGCKRGGGLALGASNAVVMETPWEHYEAMLRAWREHG
jgi:uroporphyrinogen decarboxylase